MPATVRCACTTARGRARACVRTVCCRPDEAVLGAALPSCTSMRSPVLELPDHGRARSITARAPARSDRQARSCPLDRRSIGIASAARGAASAARGTARARRTTTTDLAAAAAHSRHCTVLRPAAARRRVTAVPRGHEVARYVGLAMASATAQCVGSATCRCCGSRRQACCIACRRGSICGRTRVFRSGDWIPGPAVCSDRQLLAMVCSVLLSWCQMRSGSQVQKYIVISQPAALFLMLLVLCCIHEA
eukprot:357027-Chlamydomonas_euryale.AAC.5